MPARLRAITRALKKLGQGHVVTPGGKHFRVTAPDGKVYPIPAHNGEKSEIDDVYISAMCRQLKLDEAALRRHL